MHKNSQNYLAIIGDIVGSRSLNPAERAQVQKRFQAVLEGINKPFKDEIASLFLITTGDEAQGILRRPNYCYQIIRKIQLELVPTELVFGLGYGPITTEIGEFAVGADGPAFYFARQSLNEAKDDRKAYGRSIIREVRFHSNDPLRDKIIDALFLAVAVIKSRWTDKQAKILNLLENKKSPIEVARLLNVPLSNVSRTVDNSDFREFEYLVESLQTILKDGFVNIT
ncbi:MAG: SatD family protein [bacterium]